MLAFGNHLKESLRAYYDIFEETSFACEFMARYNERNAMYALVKQNEYYAFESNEVILYMEKEAITTDFMQSLYTLIDDKHHEMITKTEDHMSSLIHVVIGFNGELTPDMKRNIKGFKYYKSFKWGLEGWLNVGMILIDEKNGQVITNNIGKKEKKRMKKMLNHYETMAKSESF